MIKTVISKLAQIENLMLSKPIFSDELYSNQKFPRYRFDKSTVLKIKTWLKNFQSYSISLPICFRPTCFLQLGYLISSALKISIFSPD